MKDRVSWLAAGCVLITLCLSTGRWVMEAMPRKVWRHEETRINRFEYCPDGMCQQIDLFAMALQGRPHATQAFLQQIQSSHQSSTYLVSLLAGPLVVAGLQSVHAFMVVSAVAGILVVLVLVRMIRQLFADPRWQAAVLLLYLFHPATVRCFVRPQTDGLMGLFALVTIAWGWRIAQHRPRIWEWCWLALVQFLATLVKIHALSFLLVPPTVVFLCGVRGRRFWATALAATVVPAVSWFGLFSGLQLFGTIEIAWGYLGQFYKAWTPLLVMKVLLVAVIPYLLPALTHPRFWRGVPAACLAMVAGFGFILIVSRIPPVLRFQYPAIAPMMLLLVLALRDRFGARPWVFRGLFALAAWGFLLSWGLLGLELYGRYVGPTRALSPLDQFFIHLM